MALGLIGRKVGMTRVFTERGDVEPVTVIEAGPCVVVQAKTPDRDGYAALQLGFGSKKAERVPKPYRNHCEKAGKGVFRILREFRVEDSSQFQLGQEIRVGDLFRVGDLVDVTGTTKGRGFTGVMKRHGFGGAPASHGTHEYFRHGGSIGNRSFPGRVFKGKRMAGRYGGERVTIQNLEVVAVHPDENVLVVRGAVPGARNGFVLVRPAVKGRRHG
ncbi:MAG: 50S ribosomal protein L3 [Candidatus Binatia bacterium]|nr:MAG: 50S ribosomal protein L3 [Candidatus Binatia bacterium]